MPDLGEFLRRRGADASAQRLGVGEFGNSRLQRVVAAAQRIVIGVGNGRRVLAVIAPVMLGDLGAEPRMFGAGVVEARASGERADLRVGHRRADLSRKAARSAEVERALAPAASASSGATQANSGIWWRAQVNWRLA